jgi:hypothetical protein
MKLLTATALGLLLIGNANAYNVLIDFEDSPLDGDFTSAPQDPISSRGFNFSGELQKGVMYWPEGPIDDSKALAWCTLIPPTFDWCMPDVSITMTQEDLVAFDLLSLDLGRKNVNLDFELTGYFAGGGSISTTVYVQSESLTTFTFDSGWTNLQSVVITPLNPGENQAVALDNISVSTIPVPAAVWLFASGLGLLGWIRRRA